MKKYDGIGQNLIIAGTQHILQIQWYNDTCRHLEKLFFLRTNTSVLICFARKGGLIKDPLLIESHILESAAQGKSIFFAKSQMVGRGRRREWWKTRGQDRASRLQVEAGWLWGWMFFFPFWMLRGSLRKEDHAERTYLQVSALLQPKLLENETSWVA